MTKIHIQHLSRYYVIKNQEKFFALKDVNLTLPDKGLVCIVGKSGSGKSTLLNMLALMDKPSEGRVFVNGFNIHLLSSKRKMEYLKAEIGILFQSYNLLEGETVLTNITIPLLMSGMSKKKASKLAIELLENFAFNKANYYKKVELLSGGEKQRVALFRSIVNNPSILLADEPTGALDEDNSFKVMECFKKISQNSLVIIVSHNNELVEKYADRIITLKDGMIKSDKLKNKSSDCTKKHYHKRIKHGKSWIGLISKTNFLKRIKRNIVTTISFSICLLFSLLIFGFLNGAEASIQQECYKQLDYGVISLSKEISNPIDNSGLSIVRTLRPSYEEMQSMKEELGNFYVEPNIETLINSYSSISYKGKTNKNVYLSSIYSFNSSLNPNLLSGGYLPKDSLEFVLINQSAFEILNEIEEIKFGESNLNVESIYQNNIYTLDDKQTVLLDVFKLKKDFVIAGVVEEMEFLNSPKIYYSHIAMKEFLGTVICENHSIYENKDITWLDEILNARSSDPISGYSWKLFLKDYKEYGKVKNLSSIIKLPFSVTSGALMIEEALFQMIDACKIGMCLFLIICIIGTILILGIVTFSSYQEDRKKSAILKSMGASDNEICELYTNENCLVGISSLLIALVLSLLLTPLVNIFIQYLTGYSNMINVPLASWFNIPLFLPLILLLVTLLVCYFSCRIPILFSKKISIKDELKNND